jgi:Tol biopolymer transport system component
MSLAPDGRRVAIEIDEDIWIWNFARETLTRFTYETARERNPVWSPDGDWIVYSALAEGRPALLIRAADGTGVARVLGQTGRFRRPEAF